MAKRSRNLRRNRQPAQFRYATPSLEIVALQLDALMCHPEPEIHLEAIGIRKELRRCVVNSSVDSYARLHAALDHALRHAQSDDHSLFLAPHSAVSRMYRAALSAAGPVPDVAVL
jgi:hypothetical protein